MDKKLQEQFKNQLQKERDRIKKQLQVFARQDSKIKGNWSTNFPSFGNNRSEQDENADEVERYANLLPIEYTLEQRLSDIEKALTRIKNNAYGQCSQCQQSIEIDRLKICPEAKACVKCKDKK